MNNKLKRLLALLLTLAMVFSLMSTGAWAAETEDESTEAEVITEAEEPTDAEQPTGAEQPTDAEQPTGAEQPTEAETDAPAEPVRKAPPQTEDPDEGEELGEGEAEESIREDAMMRGGAHTHGEGSEAITFDTAWDGTSSTLTAGSYYLTADVERTETLTISGTVNLCLNGHGIKKTGSGSVIEVPDGATLNLYDCGTTEHKFTVNDSGLAVLNDSGNKTFTGGYITGGAYDVFYDSHGVYVKEGSSGGTFNMNGGTIIGISAQYGGGVRNIGTFTMNGGAIIGNTAVYGGGVHSQVATFTMNGGEITDNTALYNEEGGFGGGVYFDFGGDSTRSFTMTGGSISGNHAQTRDGGVFFTGLPFNPPIYFSGTPVISGNTATADKNASNLMIQRKTNGDTDTSEICPIIITGTLTQGASIGVAVKDEPGTFTNSTGQSVKASDYASFFTSDNSSYEVQTDGDELTLGIPHTHSFTYAAGTGDEANTITATCSGAGNCDITQGLTLTISAPSGTLTYDGSEKAATLNTGYDTTAFPGNYSITYTKQGDASFTGTPTDVGTYTASVTVGDATASVSYTIAEPAPALTIGSVEDWNSFAANVKAGNTYSGQTIRMTADVGPVTTMVEGTFSGTFDGGGHTLTVIISGGTVATFEKIKDGTIQNLTLAGSVTGTGIHSAALVKSAEGTVTIKYVDVNADVNCSNDYIGGFIGHAGTSNTIIIENSVYSGNIKKTGSAQGNFIGGFIGWSQKVTATIDNCAFTGSYSNIKSFNNIGFSYNAPTKITVNNFYSNVSEVFVANVNHGTRLYTPSSAYPDSVALVESGDNRTFYTTFSDALTDWTNGTTLMLLADVSWANAITSSDTRTLDLNGRTLTLSKTMTVTDGTLTIRGTSGGKLTKIGTVLSVSAGAELTIAGGTISGTGTQDQAAFHVSGTVNVNGGTLQSNASNAISITEHGTLNLNGGTVSSASNSGTMTTSSAVYAKGYSNITVNLSGTTITTNAGCGIYTAYADTIVNISGGSIQSGSYALSGSKQGTTTLSGAPELGGKGIYLLTGKTIKITGELNNSTPISVTMQTPGVFTSTESASLACNDAARFQSGSTSNIVGKNADGQLFLGAPFTVTYASGEGSGTMTDTNSPYASGSSVTVLANEFTETEGNRPFMGFKIGDSDTIYANAGDSISGAATTFTISGNTTLTAQWAVASVTANSATTNYRTFAEAVSAWNSAGNGATLKLLTNVTTASTITVSGTKALDLNGCGLKRTGTGRVISISSGATLNLTDSGSTVHKYTIASPAGNGAGLAAVNDSATGDNVKTFTGGYITGGSINDNGGGILVTGTLNMTGGTIIGNRVPSSSGQKTGGGIYVAGGGKFNMTGGAIIGNTATYGGGIGSTVPSGNGSTVLNLSGGTIEYNKSAETAGGVHGNANTNNASRKIELTITGTVSIRNNHTDGTWDYYAYAGGGVVIDGVGHILNLSGAPTIQGNTAGEGTESHPVVDNNLCFINRGNPKMRIGELSNTVLIGVTMQTPGVFTNTESANLTYNNAGRFKSDNGSYLVGKNAAGQLLLGAPCSVTYDANGGSGAPTDSSSPYASGSSVAVLAKGSLARDGYTFAGWKIGTANTIYANSADSISGATESFTISGNTTLTAQWTAIPATAPTISADPENLTLTYGYSEGSLSVTAEPATDTTYNDLAYQWYSCDDTNKTNPQAVTGADGASYAIPTGKTANTTEYYYCVVTAARSDNGQTATAQSSVATVTVSPAIISSVTVTDITAPAANDTSFDTDAVTDTANVTLSAVSWEPSTTPVAYATAYTATVTATAAANYVFADSAAATINGQTAAVTKNQDGTLTISYAFPRTGLAPVTITAQDQSVPYSAGGISIPVNGMFTIPAEAGSASYAVTTETGDTGEGTFAEGKLTVTKCGTFTVKVSTAATDTHDAANASATLTVNPMVLTNSDITITLEQSTYTYDGTAKQPGVTVTLKGTDTEVPASEYTVSWSNNVNAGGTSSQNPPTVTITDNTGGNYTVSGSATFTISPKDGSDITPTADNTTLTYSGEAQGPTISIADGQTELRAGTDYDVTYQGRGGTTYADADNTPSETAPTNAGDYTAVITCKGNYSGGKTVDFTIQQATPTLSGITTGAIAYGQTLSSSQGLTGTATGVKNETVSGNWTFTNGTVKPAVADSNSTEYDVTFASSDSNYGNATGKVKLTVNPKALDLSWDNTSFTYNGESHVPTASATNLESGDTVGIIVDGAQTDASSTPYTATAASLDGSSAANYTLPDANTHTFTIVQKTAELSWGNTSFTYNGAAQAPAATVSNLAARDADKVMVTVTGAETNASSTAYTATASALTGDRAGNYKLPDAVTKAFTIGPKSVTVTPDELSTAYGQDIATLTFTVSGLVNENHKDSLKVKLSSTATKTSPAGQYPITGEQEAGYNTNYTVTFDQTKQYTINEANANITASAWSGTYDGQGHSITVSVTDSKNSESLIGRLFGIAPDQKAEATVYYSTVSAEDALNRKSTENPAFTDVGTYPVYYVVVFGGNYASANPVTGSQTVSISEREVGLSWSDSSFTYDGKLHLPTATATNLVEGEACTVTVTGATRNAGSYTATATALDNPNYRLPGEVTQSFTIAPQEVGLTWSGTSFTYNGKSHAPTATATDLVDGDTCTVTVTGAQTNAGTYTATASKLSNANYKLPEQSNNSFTIAQKVVGLEWANTKFTYNGKSHVPTATATGLVNGDTCTVTVTGTQTNAGTYTAKASELSNANYKLPGSKTNRFTIAKASQKAPSAPVVTATTGTTITVKAVKGQQYRISGSGKWQSGGTFKGLKVGTSYTIYTRKVADANHTISPTSKGTKARTLSAAVLMQTGTKISASGNTITVKFGKVPGATDYDVYVTYCGEEFDSGYTVTTKKLSVTIMEIGKKPILTGKNYKVYIVARNGKTVLGKTTDLHGVASGRQGKWSDAKSITLSKTSYTIAKGRSVNLGAEVVPKSGQLGDAHGAILRYVTSDSGVATVDGSGKVTAKGVGVCTIQVIARNGLSRNVTVTVVK